MKDELVIFVENNLFESELIEKRIKDTISTTIHQPGPLFNGKSGRGAWKYPGDHLYQGGGP